jgi:hypothetical protein
MTYFAVHLQTKAKVRKRLAAAYLTFMRRHYFSRVWVRHHRMTYLRLVLPTTTSPQILQELFLAQEISCVGGRDSQPFPHVLAISLLVTSGSVNNGKAGTGGLLHGNSLPCCPPIHGCYAGRKHARAWTETFVPSSHALAVSPLIQAHGDLSDWQKFWTPCSISSVLMLATGCWGSYRS